MLTRKKRIDSSPKPSVTKNLHLLSRETIQDTVNMLSTPTRRNPFMLGGSHGNTMNDDSPVLSQESINIAWKWNNEGTPIRPANKSSKLRRSITNNSAQLHNLRLNAKRKSTDIQNGTGTGTGATTSATSGPAMSPKVNVEPETHSPKGLYKFQEEMRKIQFDTESDTSCDNFFDINKSLTADTGYPTTGTSMEGTEDLDTNARCSSDILDVHMDVCESATPKVSTQNENHGIDDAFADDLLNDSDFDQILLTCKMPAQKEAPKVVESSNSSCNPVQNSVKKANSAPEIKASGSSSSGSNWNLIEDDCFDDFDDLVKDFDVDITSDALNTSGKFTRHKSMPQHPQSKPNASHTKKFVPQLSTHLNLNSHLNRKSFTRHESMPITNSTMNRPPIANNNNIPDSKDSGISSTQTRKCTSEEIAEKRRIALERLKNRKHVKINK